MQPLFTSQQIKQAELSRCEQTGCTFEQMIAQAGLAAYQWLAERYDKERHILLIAGRGNNGADTYVCATWLHTQGYYVHVQALGDPCEDKGSENDKAKALYLAAGGSLSGINLTELNQFDLIVDGLLGTGIQGALRANVKEVIEAVNKSHIEVVSLDIPSGLNSDSGWCEQAIVAQHTLVFGALKSGLFTSKACAYAGNLTLLAEDFAPFLPKVQRFKVDSNTLAKLLQPRAKNAHKGDNGKLFVVGGDLGMVGAVRLAGEGALRAGAGLVTLVSHPEHQLSVNMGRPELMFFACQLVDDALRQRLERADVLLVGPGLGTLDWGYKLLKAVAAIDKPTVYDADALNLLAIEPDKNNQRVLTPHPGEAARLLGIGVEEVERDRFTAVKLIQEKYAGVVVLKGPGTLIYDGLNCYVAPVGNAGLASGGCGDVLAGVIAALMAQGESPVNAAILGVIAHGEAAQFAASDGIRGMLASDLMLHIRKLLN